jgi:phosphoribosylformylglycinamidine synthase
MTSHFHAQVHVFPRREILDPQGKAIGDALSRVGFDEVDEVRAGKSFHLELTSTDRSQAEQRLKEMCETLLANTIIEDYTIELVEAEDSSS